jgi:tetratricopeptide (TPR) repeat protein
MMLVLQAGLHLWVGRTDEAVVAAAEADAIFARIGDVYGRSQSVATYARALMMSGQIDEGLAAFEAAVESAGDRADMEAELLARTAMSSALVQLGDPDAAFATGVMDIDHAKEHPGLGDSERLVSYALASLQQGRVADAEGALAQMAVRGGEGSELRPLTLCALALTAAVGGRAEETAALALQVPRHAASTYLDEAIAEVATGLARARAGDAVGSAEWIGAATKRVDATGDRLFQAVVRLAGVAALRALGDPEADALGDEAEIRLTRIGIDADGWRCAFAHAAGIAP